MLLLSPEFHVNLKQENKIVTFVVIVLWCFAFSSPGTLFLFCIVYLFLLFSIIKYFVPFKVSPLAFDVECRLFSSMIYHFTSTSSSFFFFFLNLNLTLMFCFHFPLLETTQTKHENSFLLLFIYFVLITKICIYFFCCA